MKKQRRSKDFLPQPNYEGGPKALTEFIRQNLRYPIPHGSEEERKEGVVLVEIEIGHKGNVQQTKVLQGLGNPFDEEACRVAKMLRFEVGKVRGIRILFHKKIKFHFKAPPAPSIAPQIQYNLVPSQPKTEEQAEQKPQTGNITYTIRF